MDKNNLTSPLIEPSLSNKLGILFLSLVVMIIVTGLFKGFLDYLIPNPRCSFMIASVMQSVFAFIFPAWLTAFLCSTSSSQFLGISTPVVLRQFIAVVVLMLLIMPVMNFIVQWNADISLPSSMSGLEKTMREWEENAASITEMILSDVTVWGLVVNILVVGLITGFAEECFFRGGLQNAMTSSGINHHLAIWIVAFVFSTLHFQFFGFVPRMLLGALFGYIYFSSKSLWVSASAHALNNSIVVVTVWLSARGFLDIDLEMVGVEGSDSLLWLSTSLVLTLVFIILFWKKSFSPPKYDIKNTSYKNYKV